MFPSPHAPFFAYPHTFAYTAPPFFNALQYLPQAVTAPDAASVGNVPTIGQKSPGSTHTLPTPTSAQVAVTGSDTSRQDLEAQMQLQAQAHGLTCSMGHVGMLPVASDGRGASISGDASSASTALYAQMHAAAAAAAAAAVGTGVAGDMPTLPGGNMGIGMVGVGHIDVGSTGVIRKVKGPWRPEEDAILSQLVTKLGPRRWTLIASHIAGRTGKQARERWLNQLSPDLEKRPWTAEEDQIVMEAHARLGNRWSEIAKLLKGRTDNATKNRFNTTIRRRISELGAESACKQQQMQQHAEGDQRPEETGGAAVGSLHRIAPAEPGSLVTSCGSTDGQVRVVSGKRKRDEDGDRNEEDGANGDSHERVAQRTKTLTALS